MTYISRFRSTVLLFAITIVSLYAQTGTKQAPPLLAAATPETAGFSSERLNRIDGLIQSYIDKKAFPGVAAIVVRNGKIVYHKAFGTSDLDNNKPLAKDAIYRIASMTKAITSLAVMMLHEEGKIMLDDPISKYIPEFAKPVVLDKFNDKDSTYTTIPAKREITIRHLLTHMSGLNYNVIASDPHMRAIYTKAGIVDAFTTQNIKIGDAVRKLAKLPLNHQPGEKWTYGLSIDVLGALVEVVSGLPLDQFFQKRIFEPLGMKDTYFYLPDSKRDRLVALYSEDKDKKLVKTATIKSLPTDPDFPIVGAKAYFSGGGGLSSTAYDYAVFLQMLLNNGVYNGKRFLSRKGVELFTNSNQTGALFPDPHGYFSLGFAVTNEKGHTQDLSSVGTFSWGGAFSTDYFADPKEKICAVLMKQMWGTSYGSELDNKFSLMIYQALDDQEVPEPGN
ncbi:serine hydrolase domain-containing protein [Spirosoma fluviale]|uniref:CubicO group peptidase, beta-lactamase class C family n=1 Tax=Spirosoma fluviale TaxID=1597977 RepID=A0A286GEB9_9BACT|nr:serine hydrolase domain-containing protein [Spirosoma fluviale]SOD93479.1 CubicO group peptidase, beta-lactamase class C family [Spirosoma fluviale]